MYGTRLTARVVSVCVPVCRSVVSRSGASSRCRVVCLELCQWKVACCLGGYEQKLLWREFGHRIRKSRGKCTLRMTRCNDLRRFDNISFASVARPVRLKGAVHHCPPRSRSDMSQPPPGLNAEVLAPDEQKVRVGDSTSHDIASAVCSA